MNTLHSWLTAALLGSALVACDKGGAPEAAKPAAPASAPAPVAEKAPAPAPAAEADIPVPADFRAEAEAALTPDGDLAAALDALEKEIDAAD